MTTPTLQSYIIQHTDIHISEGMVDVHFFKTGFKFGPEFTTLAAERETFMGLIADHDPEFAPCDVLDGKEHGFIELGAWIGDQGLALRFMALGEYLGMWKVMTPLRVLGDTIPKKDLDTMAGMGLITIQFKEIT